MQVTCCFEPDCQWTWITSRWLVRAAGEEGLDLRWSPFSLFHLNGSHPEQGALRVVQHLVARDDHEGVARFYDEVGDRVHRRRQPMAPPVVEEAARAAGLDDDAVAAAGDASLDPAIAAATDLAYGSAGPDIGSPVLHWLDEHGQDVWIFGPLLDRVPDAPCAAELWRGVRHLAVHAMFKELKRGRRTRPDLASS